MRTAASRRPSAVEGVSPPPPARLDEEVFHLLDEMLSERLGLSFPIARLSTLESRLRPRLDHHQLRSFFDYYLMLRYDFAAELPHLARLITNNETYFLRETEPVRDLWRRSGELLGGTPRRVLSAGCSSGEEAYSTRIVAEEQLAAAGLRVWGIDVDPERIAQAQRAVYRQGSLRALTRQQCRAWFDPDPEGGHRLRHHHRLGVTFAVGNIVDRATLPTFNLFDVVLCRNVLIYFSETALLRAIDNFAALLRPGGVLLLGHSESIIGRSPAFETIRLSKGLGYRRL